MSPLPSAAMLAALVIMAGGSGVGMAEYAEVSTPTVASTAVAPDRSSNVTALGPDPPDDRSFETHLVDRLDRFNLTDEQRRLIVAEAGRLRDADASRPVIRSSIVMRLYEFGVEAPFLHAGNRPSAGSWLAERLGERFDLSDEPVAEIAATIDQLHENGTSRVEIYRAVRGLLIEYGVDEDEVDRAIRNAIHRRAHQLQDRSDALDDRAHRLHHLAHRLGNGSRGSSTTDR